MTSSNSQSKRYPIRNSAEAIEAYADVYGALLQRAGLRLVDVEKKKYRAALESLIRLACNEYAARVAEDFEQAMRCSKRR